MPDDPSSAGTLIVFILRTIKSFIHLLSHAPVPMTPRTQADTEADDRAWYDDEESSVVDESSVDGKFLGDSRKFASKEAEYARRQAIVRCFFRQSFVFFQHFH
jgi:hypothetical protein